MKNSESEDKSDLDSTAGHTREELERLIEQAPTAIHRQALEQQLLALGKADKTLEKPEAPVKQDESVDDQDQIQDDQQEPTVEQQQEQDKELDKEPDKEEPVEELVEVTDVSTEQDKIVEKVEGEITENRLLGQQNETEPSHAATTRKSRLISVKAIFLAIAALLVLAITIVIVRPNLFPPMVEELAVKVKSDAQVHVDKVVIALEQAKQSVQSMFSQTEAKEEEETTVDDVATSVSTAPAEPNTQNLLLDMYEAKSMALDAVVAFDNFVELNGMPSPQREAEIKLLLQSAQDQQQYERYDEAIALYRQVSADLEGLMTISEQLMEKQRAVELARLKWESYRWQFYRDAENLSLTPEESKLIELENEISTMIQSGATQQIAAKYRDIDDQYAMLLDAVKDAARERSSVVSIRQHWQQFREQYDLDDELVADLQQNYQLAIELESTGDLQGATDNYKIVFDGYKKVLKEQTAVVVGRGAEIEE